MLLLEAGESGKVHHQYHRILPLLTCSVVNDPEEDESHASRRRQRFRTSRAPYSSPTLNPGLSSAANCPLISHPILYSAILQAIPHFNRPRTSKLMASSPPPAQIEADVFPWMPYVYYCATLPYRKPRSALRNPSEWKQWIHCLENVAVPLF